MSSPVFVAGIRISLVFFSSLMHVLFLEKKTLLIPSKKQVCCSHGKVIFHIFFHVVLKSLTDHFEIKFKMCIDENQPINRKMLIIVGKFAFVVRK